MGECRQAADGGGGSLGGCDGGDGGGWRNLWSGWGREDRVVGRGRSGGVGLLSSNRGGCEHDELYGEHVRIGRVDEDWIGIVGDVRSEHLHG